MPLPSSGAISLLDVATEFGGTSPHALNEYYAAAAGVPASGVISLSDFYGKANQVVFRIYPALSAGTNVGNASDGSLTTYASFTNSNNSLSTAPPDADLHTFYGEMYVKSVRVYAKYRVATRYGTANCNASHSVRMSTASITAISSTIKAPNTTIAFNTDIVDDVTINATANAKMKDLTTASTASGFDPTNTYLRLSNDGYSHTSWLYEMFYDLTLSGAPPV